MRCCLQCVKDTKYNSKQIQIQYKYSKLQDKYNYEYDVDRQLSGFMLFQQMRCCNTMVQRYQIELKYKYNTNKTNTR